MHWVHKHFHKDLSICRSSRLKILDSLNRHLDNRLLLVVGSHWHKDHRYNFEGTCILVLASPFHKWQLDDIDLDYKFQLEHILGLELGWVGNQLGIDMLIYDFLLNKRRCHHKYLLHKHHNKCEFVCCIIDELDNHDCRRKEPIDIPFVNRMGLQHTNLEDSYIEQYDCWLCKQQMVHT